MKRILILYRELAGYFIECLNHMCENHDVTATVVAYPVNSDAPFRFQTSPKITIVSRETLDQEKLIDLVKTGGYDLIFCGGWSDKEYLNAIKYRKCKSLLGFDNQWNGSIKHILSSFYGRLFMQPLFEYAFVPGSKQFVFAKHLGFKQESIIQGAYSCAVDKFSKLHTIRLQQKRIGKKKLIYAGRYAEEKFILQLQCIVQNLVTDEFPDWELHCIGTGPLWEKRIISEGIFHHGFMQPEDLFEFLKDGDAFVLPSTFEPWGVVVHEFAAAGYPLILSSAIGSAEVFLENRVNGFLFKSGDEPALRQGLIALFQSSDAQLREMGNQSARLAKKITPETWAKSLYSIM